MVHIEASINIYIQEELSDARLRCDELKRQIAQVLELVSSSDKRDHLYAIAGDLIQSIPTTILKLERALEAAAMAVNEMDNADIKTLIRPEKVDELEKVLDSIRIKIPRRTGGPFDAG